MYRLLFIFERDMPTISIMREILSELTGADDLSFDFMYLTDVKPADIETHDGVVFLRPNDIYSPRIARAARRSGRPVIVFCDDDLMNLPAVHPTIPWRKRGLLRTLENADMIWSSSRYITEKYRAYTAGGRTLITDTVVRPDELEDVEPRGDDGAVRIVYAAAPSHAALFERYISPILPELADSCDGRIKLTFVSVHPRVEGAEDRIDVEYVPGMPLLEYRRYMKQGRFDIGVAPLNDDEFSKCKYFNKFLEYTTHGTVGVYSNTEPYTYVISDGVNGFLADNDPQSWLSKLGVAIRDRQTRVDCLRGAVEYVRQNHSQDRLLSNLRAAIPPIMGDGASYQKCPAFTRWKALYRLSRPLDWGFLTLFYLRHTGIRAVVDRTKTHFIEGKAYRRKRA